MSTRVRGFAWSRLRNWNPSASAVASAEARARLGASSRVTRLAVI